MADKIQTLLVSLEARINQYESTMRKALATTNSTAKKIEDRFAKTNTTLASRFGDFGGVIGRAFAGAAALRGAQSLIDASTRIENSLKVAGLAGEDLTKVYDALFASAQKNAAPLESLVQLYSRASLSAKELGVSQDRLIKFTDNVALALRVSGQSSQEASGALLQLSQLLGSGTVRAEEFNSVQEGALPILQAVANGIKQAGGSVAKLRALVIEGKISSKAFFDAYEAGAPILQEKVAGAALTVAQRFENLKTTLIDAAGKFDEATGASDIAGTSIENLAGFIQNLGDVFRENTAEIGFFVGKVKELNDFLAGIPGLNPFANVSRDLESIRAGIEDLKGSSKSAAQEIDAASQSVDDFLQGFIDVNSSIPVTEEQRAAVQAIAKDFDGTRESADKTLEAMLDLGDANPDLAKYINGLIDLVAHFDAVTGAAQTAKAAAAFSDIGSFPSAAALGGIATPIKTIDITDPNYKPTGKSGGGGSKKSPGEKFSDTLDQQREQNRMLQEQTALQATLNPLVDDYGFALEKLNIQQELQTAATRAGIELTPALKATIDELSVGYANASVEAAKLAESQDRVRQTAEEWRDISKDVTRGFIDDIVAGTSALDALGNALTQVGSKLLDSGLDMLFGGGGTSGFGAIGKIFGFDNGGYTGDGGKDEPAGVVHKGEYVFTKAQTKALGAGNLAALARGYANDGLVGSPPPIMSRGSNGAINAPVSIQIDATGADAAGLARLQQQLAQMKAELPGTIVGTVRTAKQQGKLK